MIGTTELLLLGGLALLIFGGKKVPELMRGLGQGVKEFKKGMEGIEDSSTMNDKAKSSNEEKANNTSIDNEVKTNNAED
jgi:sec-independent protein translocase protein TatA